MKKILFTIQWYPSVLSANALCDQKIIDLISCEEDYEITCLAYKPFGSLQKETIGKIKVYRFNKGLWWNIKIQAKANNGKYSKIILAIDKLALRIRQVLTIPIYPVMEPFANTIFALKALKLYKQEHFDIVISEFHGLDSLHAGSVLKKHHPHVIFMPILWDAFTGKQPAGYLPAWYANWKMKKAEMRELSCADKIIVMESSRGYHEQHSIHKSYYDRLIYLDIPGIIKHPMPSTKSSLIHKGKLNIVYAGILSLPDRDPEYIIQALSRISNAANIHILFICIGEGRKKIAAIKDKIPCEITISNYVDKKELNAIYQEADVLLNLGGPNPNMVPSKVFEYLSYGKPIISTYYIDNEASLKYLRKYPLSVCVDQRKPINESTEMLNQQLKRTIGERVSFEFVQQIFANNTPEKYIEVIESMI